MTHIRGSMSPTRRSSSEDSRGRSVSGYSVEYYAIELRPQGGIRLLRSGVGGAASGGGWGLVIYEGWVRSVWSCGVLIELWSGGLEMWGCGWVATRLIISGGRTGYPE
ncbi:hypothetical protein Tco_0158539 [Tanacetum coccineum]